MLDIPTFALCVSAASFALSIFALWLTYRQKSRQDSLASRKALTDTVAAIVNTNIEMAKLQGSRPEIVSTRRNLNAQRRYLAHHAELLTSEIPDLSTDIDHQLIAGAFDANGDQERAQSHWKKCINKSPAPALRSLNLTGYARFMFHQGQSEAGRKLFEEAVNPNLPDTDLSRHIKADILASWATTERDYGFGNEGERRHQQALAEARRIGTTGRRDQVTSYVESLWRTDPKEIASALPRDN
jgi:tetratricopeptide (TPR) repeat protein